MKIKIILLLFVSVLAVSFTVPTNIETPTDPVEPKVICLTVSDLSDLENLDLEDEINNNPYTIQIVWIGDAAWQGSMGFQQLRETVRQGYENKYGKQTQETTLGLNNEIWYFDGTVPKTNVEATMQSDPNVDVDDD